MTGSQRILFVGHDASRTGAPILLLHFLRWLGENSPLNFEILLKNGGELVPQYAAIAPTRVLHQGVGHTRWQRLWRRARRHFRPVPAFQRTLLQHYPIGSFPLVYSNTVANGDILGFFGPRGHRIICHAHEMRYGIERWGGQPAQESARFVHSFVAASNAVKRDVIAKFGIRESNVEVIHEFGQPVPHTSTLPGPQRAQIRQQLGIGADEIVVGMCGTMDWRKGADLFPLIAKAVLRRSGGRGFHFVWVGSSANPTESMQLRHDYEFLGVNARVSLVGQVPNPHDYMSAFDLFALTSREDPCPLVMLEAGSLGLPVVCFAESGGATDYVRDDAGVIVPYLDLEMMADAIIRIGSNPELRRTLGRTARDRALSGFTLQTQAPKLLAVIERNLAA